MRHEINPQLIELQKQRSEILGKLKKAERELENMRSNYLTNLDNLLQNAFDQYLNDRLSRAIDTLPEATERQAKDEEALKSSAIEKISRRIGKRRISIGGGSTKLRHSKYSLGRVVDLVISGNLDNAILSLFSENKTQRISTELKTLLSHLICIDINQHNNQLNDNLLKAEFGLTD
ncbi:MAG: hypothetical protein NZL96_02185 [Patescibacteria group bacterium]|nr:hypothetical protein [Patescibacteria group bacterium]